LTKTLPLARRKGHGDKGLWARSIMRQPESQARKHQSAAGRFTLPPQMPVTFRHGDVEK
jgi:hypothetical protein